MNIWPGFGQGLDEAEALGAAGRRTMRVRKVVKPCPTCKADIAEFLAHGQVNRCAASLDSRALAAVLACSHPVKIAAAAIGPS